MPSIDHFDVLGFFFQSQPVSELYKVGKMPFPLFQEELHLENTVLWILGICDPVSFFVSIHLH